MPVNEALLREFEVLRPQLESLGRTLQSRLDQLIRDAKIPFHSVTARVKHPASLGHKLARPDKSYPRLWDVTDLIGLRVETYFEDHVEAVSRLIEANFAVDFGHSAARERPAGYRSVHYVCATADAPHGDFRFEVQLRTVLQHAWAEVEHDLGYKAEDAVPELIRRRFARVASLLEIADQEFVSIRRDLITSRERAKAMLERREGALPIDLVSLDALSRQPVVRELDRRIATRLVKPLGEAPFFPDYLVRVLRLSGLETTTDVTEAIERHTAHLDDGFVRYAAVAKSALQFDAATLKEIERGYGLLPLAHLSLVRGPELGLSKVARLTQLYRELEFPHDEAAAHRVATAVVAGLS